MGTYTLPVLSHQTKREDLTLMKSSMNWILNRIGNFCLASCFYLLVYLKIFLDRVLLYHMTGLESLCRQASINLPVSPEFIIKVMCYHMQLCFFSYGREIFNHLFY